MGKNPDIISGIVLDEAALTADEFAHACGVSIEWVALRVETGILASPGPMAGDRRFSSRELRRARQLLALERDFDALPELAALVLDLQDEIARLRRLLGRGGNA